MRAEKPEKSPLPDLALPQAVDRLRAGFPEFQVMSMSFDQGEFNFEAPGSDAGWRRWREELEEKKRAFESRWGVVLGKRVTVWLRDHAKPLSGRLEWLDEKRGAKNATPRFRLQGLEFCHEEIESIVQESGEELPSPLLAQGLPCLPGEDAHEDGQ